MVGSLVEKQTALLSLWGKPERSPSKRTSSSISPFSTWYYGVESCTQEMEKGEGTRYEYSRQAEGRHMPVFVTEVVATHTGGGMG